MLVLRHSGLFSCISRVAVALIVMLVLGCSGDMKPSWNNQDGGVIQRYDLLELRYLTTNDYSALQQMKTKYVLETRVLIENVLSIGAINSPGINRKLKDFYRDSTLVQILEDVETAFWDMEQENRQLSDALERMQDIFPMVELPQVYTLIGDLGQSIIVSGNKVGISLDKYLGENYPIYKKYYSAEQRSQMKREYIVPDCLGIYLLSKFPLKDFQHAEQGERDFHVQCVFKVVNKLLGEEFFTDDMTPAVTEYLKKNKNIQAEDILMKYYDNV